MADAAKPDTSFFQALLHGLGWGVVGAAVVTAIGAVVFAAGRFDGPLVAAMFVAQCIVGAVIGASALAAFPIGPLAGLLGVALHRSGIASPFAYAAVGAAASAFTAVLIVEIVSLGPGEIAKTTNAAVVDGRAVTLAIAAFALVGAFGGFMAGRALRHAGKAA